MTLAVSRPCDIFRTAAPEYRQHGVAIVPCDDDKKPLVSGWAKWKGPPSFRTVTCLADKFPTANIAAVPGASRGGLICVDVDEPELTREMYQRFGKTPLVAETPAGGRHLWYRGRTRSANLRQSEGIAVDVKSLGAIVLMPPSRRQNGAYEFLIGSIDDITKLPPIRPGSLPNPTTHRAKVGERNNSLFNALRRKVRSLDSFDALLFEARGINSGYLPPMDEGEVLKTAKSVWDWSIAHPRGAWKHHHTLIRNVDIFELPPHAHQLLCALLAAHSEGSGRRETGFAISPKAMERAQTIPGWTVRAYRAARDTLLHLGRIELIRTERHHAPAYYRFRAPVGSPSDHQVGTRGRGR